MNYQNCYKTTTKGVNFNFVKTIEESPHTSEMKIDLANGHDISEYIPLYSGEVLKDSMDLSAKKTSSFAIFSHLNRKNKQVFQSADVPKQKSKSYLKMFYNHLGVPCDGSSRAEEPTDSVRATCIDDTPRSVSTDDDFFQTGNEDPADLRRFYECRSVVGKSASSCCFSVGSTSTLNTKLLSISEQELINTVSRSKRPSYSRQKMIINPPTMGRLGPAISKTKLDQLRRRQEYGQKVSDKNRIRMNEVKTLNTLNSTSNTEKEIA